MVPLGRHIEFVIIGDTQYSRITPKYARQNQNNLPHITFDFYPINRFIRIQQVADSKTNQYFANTFTKY